MLESDHRGSPYATAGSLLRAALTGTGPGSLQGVLGPLALLAAWAVVGIGGAVLTFKSD